MKKYFLFAFVSVGILACRKYQTELLGPLHPNYVYSATGWLDSIPYNPTPYTFASINGLPNMEVPANNPMTVEGVRLGRFLFYDKLLSLDSTISCGSCHHLNKAFTDGQAKSTGINGQVVPRSSMSLINIGYSWNQSRVNNFMWDGKFATLEQQALAPIENPLEMGSSLDVVEQRLRRHEHYPRLFRQAFGIEHTDQIDRTLIGKALAQFERTLNSANSKYDRSEWLPFNYLSEQEQRGFQLFLGDANGGPLATKDAECAHCHSFTRHRALFARNGFSNNGLDTAATFNDFPDKGLGGVTGILSDNGKFREVTLRNIGLTAPYMHDGRFATLEEVLDHYVSIGHGLYAPNIANELTSAPTLPTLNAQEKADIIAFLHALTDSSYFNRPAWADPFLQANPWEE